MQQKSVMAIEYMDDADRSADLCNVLFFNGEQVVAAEDVRETGTEVRLVQKKRGKISTQTLYRDVLCRVVLGMRCLFVGIEHQSQIDYTMPVRIMEYDAGTYRRQLRKIKKKHRKKKDLKSAQYVSGFSEQDHMEPVLTTVLYFGKEPWNGPRNIHGLMKLEGKFAQLKDAIPNYKINIVEMRNFPHWKSFKSDLRQVFGYLHNLTTGRDILNYVQENVEAYENFPEEAYDLLKRMTSAKELTEELKKQYQNEEGGVNMCEVLQQLSKDGKQEGFIELICRKHNRGLSVENISDLLELDETFVSKVVGLHEKHPSYDAKRLRECLKK